MPTLTFTVNGRSVCVRTDAPWPDVIASICKRCQLDLTQPLCVYTLQGARVASLSRIVAGEHYRAESGPERPEVELTRLQ